MKTEITIFIAILFASTILTSCGGNDKTTSSNSSENVLQNNIYIYPNGEKSFYFYDNDSCMMTYTYQGYEGTLFSKPIKYKISGNGVTIGDSSKYRILGSHALLFEEAFIDGEGRQPLLKSNDFAPLIRHR